MQYNSDGIYATYLMLTGYLFMLTCNINKLNIDWFFLAYWHSRGQHRTATTSTIILFWTVFWELAVSPNDWFIYEEEFTDRRKRFVHPSSFANICKSRLNHLPPPKSTRMKMHSNKCMRSSYNLLSNYCPVTLCYMILKFAPSFELYIQSPSLLFLLVGFFWRSEGGGSNV